RRARRGVAQSGYSPGNDRGHSVQRQGRDPPALEPLRDSPASPAILSALRGQIRPLCNALTGMNGIPLCPKLSLMRKVAGSKNPPVGGRAKGPFAPTKPEPLAWMSSKRNGARTRVARLWTAPHTDIEQDTAR
ncbi:MAG: hypothetical protein QOI25_1302, partial [Mycobacterium sp.]|nr:hypothetical protein [Mycobacterium sp.]